MWPSFKFSAVFKLQFPALFHSLRHQVVSLPVLLFHAQIALHLWISMYYNFHVLCFFSSSIFHSSFLCVAIAETPRQQICPWTYSACRVLSSGWMFSPSRLISLHSNFLLCFDFDFNFLWSCSVWEAASVVRENEAQTKNSKNFLVFLYHFSGFRFLTVS